MKRLSTRCMCKFGNIRKKNLQKEEAQPRKQTLDFLTQFARVYRAEQMLERDICSYALN